MSYRNDPFYNLPSSETSINSANPPFAYPPSSIRFLDTQAAISGTNDQHKLKRGYIRGLQMPGAAASFATKKCSFQFNPRRILQSVQMKNDMYLPILQDPAQFTQPVGSMTNFQFDLMFDRSHEVFRGPKNGVVANLDSPNATTDIYDIGVLADLQVLYSIIGQGFSQDLIDFQTERLRMGAEQQFNAETAARAEEGSEASTSFEEFVSGEEAVSNLGTFTSNINMGNSAFLIPFPVRIIFSSLFMIDGFVTSTTVDFLKFNTNMVPIQAQIGLNVQAVYIGFAKEKTIITEQFARAQIEYEQAVSETAETSSELKQALNAVGRQFVINLTGDGNWRAGENKKSPLLPYILSETYQPSPSEVRVHPGVTQRGFKLGFSAIEESEDEKSETKTETQGDVEVEVETSYNDKILKLMKRGTIEAEYTWSVNIWGPWDSFEEASFASNAARVGALGESLLRGRYTGTEKATTEEEWGYGGDNNGIRQKEHGRGGSTAWNAEPNKNQAPNKINFEAIKTSQEEIDKYEGNNKYYVTRSEVTCKFKASVSNAEAQVFTATGSSTKVGSETQGFYSTILLNWG